MLTQKRKMKMFKFLATLIVFALFAVFADKFFVTIPRTGIGVSEVIASSPESAAEEPQAGIYRQAQISNSRQNAITRAVETVSPAVVGINVIQVQRYIRRSPFSDDPFFRHFFPDIPFEKKVKSLGSGFLFSKDGYILTNQHVVEYASEIVVTTVGGKQYVAEKIGEDRTTDAAVLQIDGENFPSVKLGDSDEVIIGEWAIALGNPFGLFDITSKPIVTVGVISAVDEDFGRQGNDRIFEDMLQTDAAINGGNSGGPLVNSNGEVIGINTWIISGSETMSANIGLGFAVPINRVRRILNDLMIYGRVDRNFWTGIHYDIVTQPIAKYLGLKSPYGVIINDIDRGSPAENAGLEISDVIVAINGQTVNEFDDVKQIIDNLDLKQNDVILLRIYRNRSFFNKRIKLESHPESYKRRN
jgi:serine protease Do